MRRSRLLKIVFVGLLMAASFGLPANAQYKTWRFEYLDRSVNDVGYGNAAILYEGQPHVFYGDETAGNLLHGWWNGSSWNFETLDGENGGNGRTSNDVGGNDSISVVIFNGQLHVFYSDTSADDLRHAWWTGTAWFFESLDGFAGPNGRLDGAVGLYLSATIFQGAPHVFYYAGTGGDLRHAWWTGTDWLFESLDGFADSNGRIDAAVGLWPAVTIFENGPHVFYWDADGGDLRHGWWNGSAWFFETLDGIAGSNGRTEAVVGLWKAVTNFQGGPHVFYYDGDNQELRHAWWNGSAWFFEALDGFSDGPNGRINDAVAINNVSTLLYLNQPHVWYYGSTGVRHAWWNGSTWMFEFLDRLGHESGGVAVGFFPAAILYQGEPHIFYQEWSNADLKHGWYGFA